MALETVTYISDLVPTNPDGSDSRTTSDDHLRNIKKAVKQTFPNITGAVTSTHTELNLLTGKTDVVTQAQLTATAFQTALPSQTGNAGKFVTTDGTNASWAFAGISDVNATITADTTLTGSYKYVPVSMTAMGKSVTLPAATGLSKGGPQFIVKNDGGYPFGVRDNTGTLLTAVAAGGVAYLTLKDNATAAGSWSVIGDNLEPGLITIDNTFSSTYAAKVLAPFVALDDNTSIHFAALSSGFAAFVVDNAGKVAGTPVTVSATADHIPLEVFKVSATSALLFYGTTTDSLGAVVLSVSGSTLSVGTALTTGTFPITGAFTGAPKVARLSATSYLASYTSGTNTGVVAFEVSGTTVTAGAYVNIITASSVSGSTTTYALTATTALVIYLSGAASPYTISAVVVSVSGTAVGTGTPGTADTWTTSDVPPSSTLLSSTKALITFLRPASTDIQAAAITISGTTVTAGAVALVESLNVTVAYTSNSATRYNPHLYPLSASTALLWYLDSSGISRAVVLSESGGTVTVGTKLYRSISTAASSSSGAGQVMPQGTSEFCALVETGGAAGYYVPRLVAHKISGTTVTAGAASDLPGLSHQPQANQHGLTRLSSGDYLVTVPAVGVNSAIPVLRSSGDAITLRGRIPVPGQTADATFMQHGVVASNRIVLLGNTQLSGTTVSASGSQLRLLNVEIAA